jgi:M-phase inducer tyrosine phosphatase
MFEHPGDVMAQEKKAFAGETGLQSIMDVDDGHQSKLPHFIPEDRPECLPRITKETLADVLDGKYTHHYDRSVVIDCRFEYEYEGGHIHGAVNYNDKELLSKELFVSNPGDKTLLIFHCEYSVHRAPTM